MDVPVWLRNLGLQQYEALFRENDIDAEAVGDLTDADLEKLGVTLGHRKRLLKAIVSLGATEPAPKPTSPAPLTLSTDAAERRPITVMFCDLVGSTSIAAKLDAEDWRNLVNAYLDEASAAVTGLGGHVLKRLGDGLMALFGYPKAQENDAERAVKAALAIQRALFDLNARNAAKGTPELSARIGLESGPVVVEAAGEVFGDAPNIAARVQAAAEPGSVLITVNVQRQVAGLFVAEERGVRELKGVSQPVQLFRIVRASGGGRRGGARTLTPFVGREEELALLARRWARARAGEGQLVLTVGEPGLGKSRLMEEFHSQLAGTPHTWVEWSASQLLQNTPLHPIAEWGRQRFGVDAPAEQRLADLEDTLRLIGLDPAEHAPLLAPLVDIPLPPGRAASFAPEELRRRQLAAMTAWVLAGARSQPVVLAFEDLHWADPTSLDLLRALGERGAQSPLLVVATTRPEFRAPWALRSHHSVISLAPLDRVQVRRMVGEIASQHALSDEIIDGVGERTGGVPLFVEEVTRLLLERNTQGGAQTIPPTLQQSLAARLDRLGEAREVAQIGAVLGRDFSYRLLSDVSSSDAGFDEPRLHAALDRLTEADLLFVDGAPPTADYRFKHALIQDAAYESLLRSRRQTLHRHAAEALRDTNAEPEAIAHHFTEACLTDLAVEWWGNAGERAVQSSAYNEAIAHFGKSIDLADGLSSGPAQSAQRLRLQTLYGFALLHGRGQGSPDAIAAFARACDLASSTEDAAARFSAFYGMASGTLARAELSLLRRVAGAFLDDAQRSPDAPENGIARRVFGVSCWSRGDYVGAKPYFEQALTIYDLHEKDRSLAPRFGYDPGVVGMFYLALVAWPFGELERALLLVEEALKIALESDHTPTVAFAHFHACLFAAIRAKPGQETSHAETLLGHSREHGLPMWSAWGTFHLGWTSWCAGASDGVVRMRESLAQLRELGVLLYEPLHITMLANAEAECGRLGEGLAILDAQLAVIERTGQHWFDTEVHRVRGELLLKRDPPDLAPAEEAFQTAVAIAHQQGTRSFELRAALSLARVYQSTGRANDAHAVLAPALEGFSPTPEMPEIGEAQTLLEQLGAARTADLPRKS